MTHDQLSRRVAARLGITIRDARRVIDETARQAAVALAEGKPITLNGVGTIRPPQEEGGRSHFRSSASRSGVTDHARRMPENAVTSDTV